MKSKIPIIRVLFGDSKRHRREIPIFPIDTPQIVYVWGKENEKFLKDRGYETRLQRSEDLPKYVKQESLLILKLIALDLALQEFDEVILLDWDCYILREFDESFYNYLREKPTQCPLYAHYKDPLLALNESWKGTEQEIAFFEIMDRTFREYSWKLDDMLIVPNFGFFYTRDTLIGKKLLDIAIENEFQGCVDELALFKYVNCTADEYIERYHPVMVYGVSKTMTQTNLLISIAQENLNKYIDTKLDMDLYMQHM